MLFLSCCSIYSQSIDYKKLELEIYALNNAQKFDESQKKLLNVLNLSNISNSDKYHVYLFLSYTQKRLQNYKEVLRYLDSANVYGKKTNNASFFTNNIKVQKAFAHFDICEYEIAVKYMESVAKTNYLGVNSENISKLMMQQGYLKYLKREYAAANEKYDFAIQLMKKSSICDLPMIFTKKMQLYAATKDTVNRDKYYNLSIHYADSCGILKYNLYTKSELLRIYRQNKNYKAAFYLQKEYNLLDSIYNKEAHITKLSTQSKENELLLEKEKNANARKKMNYMLAKIAAGIILIFSFLIFKIFQKHRIKSEIEKTKNLKVDKEYFIDLLTKREKEIYLLLENNNRYKDVCEQLNISENTLKYHVKNINRKKRSMIA